MSTRSDDVVERVRQEALDRTRKHKRTPPKRDEPTPLGKRLVEEAIKRFNRAAGHKD